MSTETQKEIISWVKTILFAVVFALFINYVVIVNANVPTGSMMDTIPKDTRLVAFRLSYLFSDPERYDIVVFKYPDDESMLYVKRVIGMPGDKVDIIDGKVYINDSGTPLRDDFIREPQQSANSTYYVPEGCYFMMGDNRNNSQDSRLWEHKYLSEDKILGKVIFSYYPNLKFIN